MKTETHQLKKPRPLQRRIWIAVFRASALVLIVCLAAIVGFPDSVGYSWLYWVALAAAFICGGAAAVLRKMKSEQATGDAAWLLGFRERGSGDPFDIDADD